MLYMFWEECHRGRHVLVLVAVLVAVRAPMDDEVDVHRGVGFVGAPVRSAQPALAPQPQQQPEVAVARADEDGGRHERVAERAWWSQRKRGDVLTLWGGRRRAAEGHRELSSF